MATITPYQLNEYTVQLTDIYAALEQDVFVRIAELLKAPESADKEYAIAWQTEKLQQLRALNLQTINMLSQVSGIATKEIIELFRRVGFDTIETVDEQVKNLVTDRLVRPENIDQLLRAFIEQTFENIDNFVNLVLIDTGSSEGTVTSVYKRIVEEVVAKVLAGNKTINQALIEAITRSRDKGIPTGFVDKGGRRWHLQEYLETAIRTTTNQVYNQVKETRQREYGIHLVIVDWYSGARPACAPIQGKVCSYRRPGQNTEGYPSIYEFGYGRPDGIRGINCRHSLIPFVKNESTNNMHPPNVSEANEYYKKQQKQRALEREIRKAKRNLVLAETIGEEEGIKHWKERVRIRQQILRTYINEEVLPRRRDKEQIIY